MQSRPIQSYTEVRLIWSQFSCNAGLANTGQKSGVRRLRVLSDLQVGESGVLVALDLPPGVQNHLMYMGFVPDAHVRALHRAPAGDPTVYSVDGIEIALRRETARAIRVASIPATPKMVSRIMESTPEEAAKELAEASR